MPHDELQAVIDQFRFRIVRKIADGGMGSVYEVIEDGAEGFQKILALKTILPELADDPKSVRMFVREAKLVANLVHENIVQIIQLGRTPAGYYILMEYVKGLPLHEFMVYHRLQRLRVPAPLAVFICARIARGLAYAHTRQDEFGQPMGIVHRDVCPSNILLSTEGQPKLTDFGVALVPTEATMTGSMQLLGKLGYMAPEQANSRPVDLRADLFSLGAVLFELLAGAPLREKGSPLETMEAALEGRVHWQALPPDLDPELAKLLRRLLATAPADRYASTEELCTALEYYIYHDGYGPTIATLAAYLREHFPDLYKVKRRLLRLERRPPAAEPEPRGEATLVLARERLRRPAPQPET